MPKDVSAIAWPTVKIGEHELTVRWTFFVQYLIARRNIKLQDLPRLMKTKEPALISLMVDIFAAAVAENFTARDLKPPEADYWAMAISQCGPEKWPECNEKLWEAVGKAPQAAAPPTPQDPAQGLTQ